MKKYFLSFTFCFAFAIISAQPGKTNLAAGKIPVCITNCPLTNGNRITDTDTSTTFGSTTGAMQIVLDLGGIYYIEKWGGYDITLRANIGQPLAVQVYTAIINHADSFNVVNKIGETNGSYGYEVNKKARYIKIIVPLYMGSTTAKLYDLKVWGASNMTIGNFSRLSIGTSSTSASLNINGSMDVNSINCKNIYNTYEINTNKLIPIIIQDGENDAYFLDPYFTGSTGISLKVKGDIITESKVECEGLEVKEIVATNFIDAKEIKAENINVKIDNLADYVFYDDYQLMGLNEVSEYIKTYKHLPEIPSAEELEMKGMDIATMNNLLLKKIEELTLYIILLNEENESIKARLYTTHKQ